MYMYCLYILFYTVNSAFFLVISFILGLISFAPKKKKKSKHQTPIRRGWTLTHEFTPPPPPKKPQKNASNRCIKIFYSVAMPHYI